MNDYEQFNKTLMIQKTLDKVKELDFLSKNDLIVIFAFIIISVLLAFVSEPETTFLEILLDMSMMFTSVISLLLVAAIVIGGIKGDIIYYASKEDFYTKLQSKIKCNSVEYGIILNELVQSQATSVNNLPSPEALQRVMKDLVNTYCEELKNKESLENISKEIEKRGAFSLEDGKDVLLNILLTDYNAQSKKRNNLNAQIGENLQKAGIPSKANSQNEKSSPQIAIQEAD